MGLTNQTNISVTIGSLKLNSPQIIVSGVFGYGEEFNKLTNFDPDDAGAIILKGVSLKPWTGNPPPRIVETAAGMINSIGLQNIGVEKLVNEKLPKLEKLSTKVIINVAGHAPQEYVEVCKIAARSKIVAAIELNLSCPNIAKGGIAFGTNPDMVKKITAEVKQAVPDLPIWVKLTPNVEHIEPIALAAVKGGADAISLINTLKGMAIDVYSGKPRLANNIGGLSGPAIKPVALLKVAEVYKAFKSGNIPIPVVGLGGVMNGSDVLEFIIAGASAVGVGTVLFYDPLSIKRINQEILQILEDKFAASNKKSDLVLESQIGSLIWN